MNNLNLKRAEEAVTEQLKFEGYEEIAGPIVKVEAHESSKHDGKSIYLILIMAEKKWAKIIVSPQSDIPCGWEVDASEVGVFWNAPADEELLRSLGLE